MEPIPSQDNTPNFIGNYANLENQRVEPENNFVIKLSELQKKNPSKKIFYIINYHKWNNGLKLSINIAIPDILKEGWIRIGAGINLLQDLPELNNITSINQIPEPFLEWNQTIEEVINNYSSISYNSSIGTIYEYGSIFMFPSLRVVRSSEYPSWNGKLIEDCYIPGSNIDYPKQIKQINTNLNSNYTGLKEGQITIVKYVVGDDYYTGIIQMIKIKEKLCYQLIGSINMNGIFNTSVKIIGDTINSGNLNVLNNNNESIVSTDNTRKITTIHDKLGINQEFHEVSGLLDIDNLTQQVIIDTNIAFSTYLLNSYNIINILIGNNKFSTVDDIQELFKIDKSLYSYGEQCYIYSSDIKPIIEPENITILYEPKTLYLNLKFEGFFKKLQNNVKIFNWILPEYNEAGDKDYIFSSCDLVYNEDIDWFLISTKSIIRDNKLISVTTFFDVTNLMKDNSYSTQLTKVLEYFSKQYMFLNYAVLLVKNPSIFKELENGNSYIFTDTIQKNPFLSNRFNLTETSKIFSLQIDGDQTYLINESDLGWCRQSAKNLYALQLNVGQVLDLEVSLLDKYFNKILNCTCNFVVTFLNDRRIVFSYLLPVNGVTYLIGTGIALTEILDQSLLIKGDNKLFGNFYVNDSYGNNIFKVDNVDKTITNAYRVGIGMDSPDSQLHVKDTTCQDVVNEINGGTKLFNILNIIGDELSNDNNSEKNFKTIINKIFPNQDISTFVVVYKIDLNDLRAEKMLCVTHWLYPEWDGKIIENINDFESSTPKSQVLSVFNEILNSELLYPGSVTLKLHSFTFGLKLTRVRIIKNNNNLYFFGGGVNIQNYNIRYFSNPNIQTIYLVRICFGKMLTNANIRLNKNKINTVINFQESENELNLLRNQTKNITKTTFILEIPNYNNLSLKDIKNSYVSILDFDSLNVISRDQLQYLLEKDENIGKKYIGLITNIKNNYSILKYIYTGNIHNVDLYKDFQTGFYCIEEKDGNIKLLCCDYSITDVLIPTLKVEGDTQIIGDLLINNQETGRNFVSIDPIQQFIGINTDERNISYSDFNYKTTNMSDKYNAKHNVYVTNNSYPVFVSERIQETVNDNKLLQNFDSCSGFTVKRKSNLYNFDEILKYSNLQNNEELKNKTVVGNIKYGSDISYELCDKTNRTVELGNVGMVIDDIGEDGYLKAGFKVMVKEVNSDNKGVNRDIMYVDNSGTLHINKIMLGGKLLEVDGVGCLKWNGRRLQLNNIN